MKITRALLAIGFVAALARPAAGQPANSRAGYSYVRQVTGEVTVDSRWNGQVQASRNMPVTAGDEITVSSGGRAEIGLADGNVLYLGGGAHAAFASIRNQQGESDDSSVVRLDDGSLILAAAGSDENAIPRIDTEDATIYVSSGARVRVNYDSNHGTVVIARAGTAEVRTRDGRHQVRGGEYLMVRGDEEPEIERGAFSRDRFDIWASEQYESAFETRSVSAQYVNEDYAGDVGSMDGYGDWAYNDGYSANVWRPHVAAGWSPYSNGSWYYTPAGLTWWSNDPWGWYPFHYGNWFFDASWGSWCWAPASVYSPAWVYWGYSGAYVGWCPVGWYGYYSPWYGNYYKQWGYAGRGSICFAINGRFPTRTVDFRGWNFTGSRGFGTAAARMDVIAGSRMSGRLEDSVAISSRPIVVTSRPGEARDAVQSYIREAPRTIDRSSSPADSTRLAPVLARERTLPPSAVEALRGRAVIADRSRLAGPGVADIAPRGALIDRTRSLDMRSQDAAGGGPGAVPTMRTDRGQPATDAREAPAGADPGIPRRAPNRVEPRTIVRGNENGVQALPGGREASGESWRGTSRSDGARPSQTMSAPRPGSTAAPDDWRARSRSFPSSSSPDMPQRPAPRSEDWRSRSSVPPARRVVEGSVPGRVAPDASGDSWRRGASRSRDGYPRLEPRDIPTYRSRDVRPESSGSPRAIAPAPRSEPHRQAAPPPPRGEVHSAPAPRSAPAPPHRQRS